LSKREREVFELMAVGDTHREIAQKLFVSVKTVETHRTRIGEKLGCRNLREIMHCAFVGGFLRNRLNGPLRA
jgi:two-component system response regulator NreC